MYADPRGARGVTLVELIVFIVIVSVGLAGVLTSLNVAVKGSADPLAPKQAMAIAEALLEEILLKGYCDPDTINTATAPPTCGANVTESRSAFDDVVDFDPTIDDGIATTVAKDAQNNDWPSGYTPKVEISSAGAFGPAGKTVPAYKIVVTVSGPNNATASLTGYRTNY